MHRVILVAVLAMLGLIIVGNIVGVSTDVKIPPIIEDSATIAVCLVLAVAIYRAFEWRGKFLAISVLVTIGLATIVALPDVIRIMGK